MHILLFVGQSEVATSTVCSWWPMQGLGMVLYLDDGLGAASDFAVACRGSHLVGTCIPPCMDSAACMDSVVTQCLEAKSTTTTTTVNNTRPSQHVALHVYMAWVGSSRPCLRANKGPRI